MNIKVLVWNLDQWKSKNRILGWEFIQKINPDIAILNECPASQVGFNSVHHIQSADWGVGIFSTHHRIDEVKIDCCHPESLVIGDVVINSKTIRSISLYGRIINGFSITTLHRSLSDLTPIFTSDENRELLLIGGDFNASIQCDERMPSFKGDKSHHLFFERLKNFRLYDCLDKFHRGRIQTLRHSTSNYPWQNDYLFASEELFEKCVCCEVINDSSLYFVSDHNPIIANFGI